MYGNPYRRHYRWRSRLKAIGTIVIAIVFLIIYLKETERQDREKAAKEARDNQAPPASAPVGTPAFQPGQGLPALPQAGAGTPPWTRLPPQFPGFGAIGGPVGDPNNGQAQPPGSQKRR